MIIGPFESRGLTQTVKEAPGMKKIRAAAALALALCIVLGLAGCGLVSQGRYRVLHTFETRHYAIGFREGDVVRYYVEAAINTLAADGTIKNIALQWFGKDPTEYYENAGALEQVGAVSERTLIVGIDGENFPLSYADGESYSGFDVDCAKAVCERLGWNIRFQPMKAEDAYIELSSGNVDVAWGGLALDLKAKNFTVLSSYLSDDVVLAARVDSGAYTKLGLKDKTLVIDVAEQYMTILDTQPRLKNRLGQVMRVTGGAQACFAMMDAYQADATITTGLAVQYYAR